MLETEKRMPQAVTEAVIRESAMRAHSIAGIESKIGEMAEKNSDPRVKKVLDQARQDLRAIMLGHENYAVNPNLPAGVGGITHMATGEVEINPAILTDLISPQGVERISTVFDHEKAHTGQVARMGDVFDPQSGEVLRSEVILEGLAEVRTAQGGDIRPDAPTEVYREGFDVVEQVGVETIANHYERGGAHSGDRMHLQTTLLERSVTVVNEGDMVRLEEKLSKAGFTPAQRKKLLGQFSKKSLLN